MVRSAMDKSRSEKAYRKCEVRTANVLVVKAVSLKGDNWRNMEPFMNLHSFTHVLSI